MFYRFYGSIISLTLNHKPVSRKFPFKTTAVRFETSSRLKFSVHFFVHLSVNLGFFFKIIFQLLSISWTSLVIHWPSKNFRFFLVKKRPPMQLSWKTFYVKLSKTIMINPKCPLTTSKCSFQKMKNFEEFKLLLR